MAILQLTTKKVNSLCFDFLERKSSSAKSCRLSLGKAFVEIASRYVMTLRSSAEGKELEAFGADCSGCQTVAVLKITS